MMAPAPAPPPKKLKPYGPKSASAGVAVLLALGIMLIPSEKRVHKPYYDLVGVLTVCEGLTGKWIDINKTYTDAECHAQTQAFLKRMTDTMGSCVGPLTVPQWKAWGHFTYNTGTTAFCKSTAARYLREEKHVEACNQMKVWTFVTIKGKKVNCRNAGRTCPGIVTRRDYEHKLCMESLR